MMHGFKKIGMSTIKFKLIIIFITLTTIPLSIVGVISYKQSFDTISNLTKSSTMQLDYQLSEKIQSIFDETSKFVLIGNSDSVYTFLTSNQKTSYEEKIIKDLFKLYRSGYKYNSSIRDVYIISSAGKEISEKKGVLTLEKARFESNPIYNQLLTDPGKVQMVENFTSEYGSYKNNSNIVSIGKIILDHNNKKIIGAIIIDFDTSVMEDICNEMKIGKHGFFYILNSENQIVFYPPFQFVDHVEDYNWHEIFKYKEGSVIRKLGGSKSLIVYKTTSSLSLGWKIVGEVPLNDIMKDAYRVRNITILLILLSIILSIMVFIYLTGTITKPLINLKDKMKQAEEGNLEVRAYCSSNDEISDLGNSFNKMIQEIEILLEKSIEEQEYLKKAELKALQAQINPHFLYNTLDAIIWMAEGNDKEKIIELVSALSGFFRIGLSRGNDWITVEREIEHSTNYLTIQKTRYGDILDYEIDVDSEIFDYKILKLIIQPVIENAIYHGIKNKREGGKIKVNGRRENEELIFEIIDSGVGLTPEKLDQIRKCLEGQGEPLANNNSIDKGFGLINVNERIRLYYGKQYGITIDSEYGKGSSVKIIIPVER
jgi:two-component system, sensor histidine kinase YesM